MHITVIGTGYVGLVTGTCLAEMGNDVTCVDIDESKIDKLNQGIMPIYEPGLEDLVTRNASANRLNFTTSLGEALPNTEVCFIAVGTPPDEDGSADRRWVLQAAKDVAAVAAHDMVIAVKSTVPVGTCHRVQDAIDDVLKGRGVDYKLSVVSNPEFLKEGVAVQDFMRPDRIVIGTETKYVDEKNALEYVAGYCVAHDVSERQWQIEQGGQWIKGKSGDTYGPIGPWLVTRDEVSNPQKLNLWLEVNETPRQNGNTETMIFSVNTIISYLSQCMSLQPGDVIATGTPPGVGLGMNPPVFLKAGDVVRLGVEGLGVQEQAVVELS